MNIQLTEDIIRGRASDQSYQKGREYYRSGAIYNPSWQPVNYLHIFLPSNSLFLLPESTVPLPKIQLLSDLIP